MDEQESSSGLMIGLIVGGAVVVVLVLLAVLGAGFWVLQPMPGPPPAAPAPVVIEEVAPAPPKGAVEPAAPK